MIFNRLNKRNSQNETFSTTENPSLMLKMVTSYSIFLLIILILFFFLYHSSFNNMRDLYNFQKKSTMVSNVELFEKDLDIMNVYCRQLLQNNQFRQLMNRETAHAPFSDIGNELKTSLATDVYPESLLPIHEVYCYLPQTGYVLSPNYFINQNRFYHWIQKYSADLYENWQALFTDEQYHYRFLPLDSYMPFSSRQYYMYIINLNDIFYMDAPAQVCFILEESELSALFDSLQSSKGDFLIAADKNGVPFLALGETGEYDLTSVSHLDFRDNFAAAPLKSAGKAAQTIGKYYSENTGYTYYYSFPSFDTTTKMAGHRILFLLIFALAFLTGGFLIFLFSRRNVRPIIRLGLELHEAVEAQNHLQEVVDSQRPIICSSYVRQLLSGTITSEEEASYIKDYLELIGDSLYYNVLYVVVYNNFEAFSGGIGSDYNTPEEFNEIISHALKNFFGEPLYCFSPADRTWAILLTGDSSEENDLILKINNIILRLHDYLLDTYDIWLFAGVGKNTDSLMNVWESYQQAVEAVSYTTKNYIFYPYEFVKKDSNVFYYPPEISTKLIHFITTGNTTQVLELFNLIHQENIEERSLPINLVKFLLSDIRNTLLKARFALPSSVDTDTVKLLDERFNEHLSFKLCEDLAMTLCKLFSAETEDSNLASTIERYIIAHYKDPSLGLNKISDEFQISESYFSHMFKEKTGVNFSTYLENIRMSEAARLIKETDISLNELYIAVGYNNSNTFRRAFKKIYGVTPSSMREAK